MTRGQTAGGDQRTEQCLVVPQAKDVKIEQQPIDANRRAEDYDTG